jgi:RNA-directed DNA polymerase
MLEALEKGVKGGKWYSLMDKVCHPKNLEVAWEKVRHNHGAAGVDRQSVERFAKGAKVYLKELQHALKEGYYQPQAVLRRWIPKRGTKKMRPLGIPTVKDRIVQTALRNVLEPIWEAGFLTCSYAFRPQHSCRDALRQVSLLLKNGYTWVVDADIQNYFDAIDHGMLMAEVRGKVADSTVLALLESYLLNDVMEGVKRWTPTVGTPQGAVISPLLANVYLHPIDKVLREAGLHVVRYADDLVILCRSEEEAKQALTLLGQELTRRKLTLNPEKTRVVDATQQGGFDFLGYHFERGYRWPRKKSMDALKDKIREKTRRTSGQSLACIISDLNPILKGWFGYFKHSHRTTFPRIDKWVRMRLRSILRKRRGGRGRGRGRDHQRWPNAYFAARGLFTLTAAYEAACQSRCGNH